MSVVTAINIDKTAEVVVVVVDGVFQRQFPAATVKASDLEGFVLDVEAATANVAALRHSFIKANVVPFPQGPQGA